VVFVFLDAGPLGIITAPPKQTSEPIAIAHWVFDMEAAGHRFIVPAIADYEVRRELIRTQKLRGINRLNTFNAADPDRFLPLTESALSLAAELWARARNAGTPTADAKELDCDVLIAAQALDMGFAPSEFIIATVNVGHLTLFAPADEWQNIKP
jgi:predicted nucleic acid-binding protein